MIKRLIIALALLAPLPAVAAQGTGCMPTTGTVSGAAFAADVNTGIAAIISTNSGSTAPVTDCSLASITGQQWVDTSAGAMVAWRMYDGASWLPSGWLDTSNHVWTPVIGGGVGTVSSASTTDLCSAKQASVTITGTTTITGFGSTCAVGQIKFLSFSGALTLTNSGTLVLPSGANIPTAAGDRAIAVQLSSGTWALFSYQKASGQPVVSQNGVYIGSATGLKITNGSIPSSQVVVTATQAQIPAASGNTTELRSSVSVTCSSASSGAGGLDTGSVATGTTYSIWLIDNGTAPACLLHAGFTSPTLPSGYSYQLWVGAISTDAVGGGNFYRFIQIGQYFEFTPILSTNTASYPTIASGVVGTLGPQDMSPFTVLGVAQLAPSVATRVRVQLSNTSYYSMVGPNNSYGQINTNAQAPIAAAGAAVSLIGDITMQTTQVWYYSAGSNALYLMGFWLPVNAN